MIGMFCNVDNSQNKDYVDFVIVKSIYVSKPYTKYETRNIIKLHNIINVFLIYLMEVCYS